MSWYQKKEVKHIILAQGCLPLFFSLLMYFIVDKSTAYAVLFSGAVICLPNLLFAIVFFQYTGAQHSKTIANAFYKAECYKFLLTIVLFVIVIRLVKINPLVFFLGILVWPLMTVIVPLLLRFLERFKSDRDDFKY